MSTVVELRDVRKSFDAPHGRVNVLNGISLAVEAGDLLAITGPSGSGKSTLLNLAAMLDTPTEGELAFDGRQVDTMTYTELCDFRKWRVGMVFQKYCLLPHRTVLENVLFRFRYVPHDRRQAVAQALQTLEIVGLRDLATRPVRLLSGGEMQRVAIARAVVLRPSLLVADEPTGNLDSRTAESVMQYLTGLNRDGLTIVLVTHNEALLEYCTRFVRCHDGRLEENSA